MKKKVLVIGGSGFIGSWIVEECLKQNFNVSVLSRSAKAAGNHSSQVAYIKGDINQLSVEDYKKILSPQGEAPFDGIIFAAGVDERVEPKGDPYDFYAQANIEPCKKLFTAAQHSSVTHGVLLNSIFAMLHRQHPELKLTEKHPYIKSRVDQSQICQQLAQGNNHENHFVLTVLEVPWVFGEVFGEPLTSSSTSQWDTLITYVRSAVPVMACRGSTNIIAVQSVAQACVAALTKPTQSSTMPLGDMNISYQDMLKHLCRFAGRRDDTVVNVNDTLFQESMKAGGVLKDLFGMKSGLDTRYTAELLLSDIEVDNSPSKQLLQYETGTALQAMEALVKSRPEKPALKRWRKLLNWFSPDQ